MGLQYVQPFAICLFSVPADSTCDAPRKEEMETKYPGKCTSIVSTILPITSAEPALFGVYAVDLLSRWRALRGFRKTLEDDHD